MYVYWEGWGGESGKLGGVEGKNGGGLGGWSDGGEGVCVSVGVYWCECVNNRDNMDPLCADLV